MKLNCRHANNIEPGNCGAVDAAVAAGLMTCPFASFISRLTRRAVGMNRVTSPMTCRICGLASMVAELASLLRVASSSPAAVLCGGFIMLGGALSMPGLTALAPAGACRAGGGTPGGIPGGRTSRGGGTPAPTINYSTLRCNL